MESIVLAEGVGFEPTRRVTPPAGFQDRCLKPLGHPSTPVKSRPYRYPDREHFGNSWAFGHKLDTSHHRRMPLVKALVSSAAETSAFLSASRSYARALQDRDRREPP